MKRAGRPDAPWASWTLALCAPGALAPQGDTESELRAAIAHSRQAVDGTLRRLGWTGPVVGLE